MIAVSAAATTPSLRTPSMAARTNSDWSANSRTSIPAGTVVFNGSNAALIPLTTSSVEAAPPS